MAEFKLLVYKPILLRRLDTKWKGMCDDGYIIKKDAMIVHPEK
jgi:hypothetical protein